VTNHSFTAYYRRAVTNHSVLEKSAVTNSRRTWATVNMRLYLLKILLIVSSRDIISNAFFVGFYIMKLKFKSGVS
jgi:hypothetical protein